MASKEEQWLAAFESWPRAEQHHALQLLVGRLPPQLAQAASLLLKTDFISSLPEELAVHVLSFLDPASLLSMSFVSRLWRSIALSNQLWKPISERSRVPELLVPILRRRMPLALTFNWRQLYLAERLLARTWRELTLPQKHTLCSHQGRFITCLHLATYGYLISGSDDCTLRVWNLQTHSCMYTLQGHLGGVWCCASSGSTLLSGSTDHTLKVWSLENGRCLHTLRGHTSTVRCVRVVGSIAVSGARDAAVRVWDIKQGLCLNVLMGHSHSVRCLEFDGTTIVSGSYDSTVRVWDAVTGHQRHLLTGHTNRVYTLQFDGRTICSGSLDMSIRVWDAVSGACLFVFHGNHALTGLMHLRNGTLVAGNSDTTIRVWDVETGRCRYTLQGHSAMVTCLSVSEDFITSCSDDGTVRLWELSTGRFVRVIADFNQEEGTDDQVVWRVQSSAEVMACAVGKRADNHSAKLVLLDVFSHCERALASITPVDTAGAGAAEPMAIVSTAWPVLGAAADTTT